MNEVFSSIKSGEQLALFSLKINRSPSTYLKSSAMSSIIFLICVLIPFVRANCDETPTVVDCQYGENKYCHFAYFGAVNPENMKRFNSPQAQVFGKGQAKGYNITFTTYPTGWVAETLVPDPDEFVCGMAYLLPVSEFENVLKNTFDDDTHQKFRKYITVNVEVTKDDNKVIPMKCNTYQVINPPKGNEIPCSLIVDRGIDAYKVAHLSHDCLAKVQNITSVECPP